MAVATFTQQQARHDATYSQLTAAQQKARRKVSGSLAILGSRAARAFGLVVFAYLLIVAAGFRAHSNQALLTLVLGIAILALTVPLLTVAERRPRYLLWIAIGVVALSAILRFAWADPRLDRPRVRLPGVS